MSASRARLWLAASAAIVILALVAVRQEDYGVTTPTATPILRPVLLPNLSRFPDSVRDRMTTAFSLVDARRQDASTPAGELAEAYGDLGLVLLAAGYSGAAEISYENAFTLAPQDYRWAYYLGHVYLDIGEVVTATRYFSQALQMAPDDIPARIWYGETMLAWGRPELSELAFMAALSYQPRSQAALFGLGRTRLVQRDFRSAVDYLERALAIDPRVSGIRYPLALAHRGLGDLTAAELHLRNRGDVQPELPDSLMENVERVRLELLR